MDTLYWIIQYIRVLIAFILILFVWPSVVFRKFLKEKSRTYRFSFCVLVMMVLINTTCITLGLFHILYKWLVCLIFYGIFIYSLLKGKKINSLTKKRMKYFVNGTYGFKSFLLDLFRNIRNTVKSIRVAFFEFMKGHWLAYTLLGILVLFGLLYFSWGSLQDYSFGCGDVYVHTSWTYYLEEGKIFPDGIYPGAMHFFIYSEIALFGIGLFPGIMFTGCIDVFITIIALFIFLREIFKWKYTPYLGIALFLMVEAKDPSTIFDYCRMQWALPQEFGYGAMFLCGAYLSRYLKTAVAKIEPLKSEQLAEAGKFTKFKRFIKKTAHLFACLKDDNLFLFTMAVATTIIIHFYSTIMTFFICLGIVIALFKQLFSKRFIRLIIGVLVSLFVAVLPMAIVFASGVPLQGSLQWAMSLFISTSEEDPVEDVPQTTEVSSEVMEEGEPIQELEPAVPLYQKINAVLNMITGVPENLRTRAYIPMHNEWGEAFYYAWVLAILLGAVMTFLRFIILKIRKKAYDIKGSYIGYIELALAGGVCHFYYISWFYGLPSIMELYRIFILCYMFALITILVPVDFVLSLIAKFTGEAINAVCGWVLVATIYVGCRVTGHFHGYLYYQSSRYNSAVMVTQEIVDTLPPESYTIVSTTDDLYQIMGKGYHEELLEFINQSEVVSYTLPTEYIFIYIEKNTLYRNQCHFITGPFWLAENSHYKNMYYNSDLTSEGDGRVKQTISEDMANVYFGKFHKSSAVYGTFWARIALNSKVYVWCQKFNAMYPNELHTYYEDEDFLVYYIRQNQRNLYELATMDPEFMIAPEDYGNPIWPENYSDMMVKEGN